PDGRIVATNGEHPPEIRFFSAEGRHQRSVGRDGVGPGEFTSIRSVWLVYPDTLIVYDRSQSRVSYLTVQNLTRFVVQGFGPWIWTASPTVYRLERWSLEGMKLGQIERSVEWFSPTLQRRIITTMIVEADLPRLEVTARERKAAIDEIDSIMSRGRRVPVDYSRIPTHHPAIENIDIDDEGQLWVRRVTRSSYTYFDVFDRGGRFVKSVATRWVIPEFWQVVIKDGSMYSVQQDSLGVHYVVRGQIERK
ncbi:MAG: hypothetical protein ACE5HT_16470, partial [Gemmatimonadales bacterium]